MLCERCQRGANPELPTIQPIDPRFLRTDYVLSSEEESQMNQLLQEEERCVQDCEEEIMRTHQRLTTLKATKRGLEVNISTRKSALSIQRSIPSEVWDMIFEQVCAPSSEGGHSFSFYSPIFAMPSIALSHVCSLWRAIALGHPKLWSSIYLDFAHLHGCKGFHLLFETFMERSRGSLLDLEINASPSVPRDDRHRFGKLFSENLQRCRSFTLEDYSCCLLHSLSFPPVMSDSFPDLVSFRCTADPEHVNSMHWLWQTLRHRAPKLSKVEIYDSYPLASIPYSQLTTLITHQVSDDHKAITEFFNRLKASSMLRQLTLKVYEDDALHGTLQPDNFPVLQMPLLTTLTVAKGTFAHEAPSISLSDRLIVLYRSLLVPSLVLFSLECSVLGTFSWPVELLEMLRRTSSLKRLSLCFRGCHGSDFRPQEPLSTILRATPNLTHLEFHMSKSTKNEVTSQKEARDARTFLSSFLSELEDSSDAAVLLPKLEYLLLRVCRTISDDSTLVGLLDAVESRVAHNPSLPMRSIRVQRYVGLGQAEPMQLIGSTLIERIKELKQGGLSFTVEDAVEVWDAFEDWVG